VAHWRAQAELTTYAFKIANLILLVGVETVAALVGGSVLAGEWGNERFVHRRARGRPDG
jgi:hypothetical protein